MTTVTDDTIIRKIINSEDILSINEYVEIAFAAGQKEEQERNLEIIKSYNCQCTDDFCRKCDIILEAIKEKILKGQVGTK